ncbi:hypothetical protein TWF281_011454 [Arthrobotrys megalospora]
MFQSKSPLPNLRVFSSSNRRLVRLPKPHIYTVQAFTSTPAHSSKQNAEPPLLKSVLELPEGEPYAAAGTKLPSLPPSSNLLSEFRRLKKEWKLSESATYIRLIQNYDISSAAAKRLYEHNIPKSFSTVEWKEIAPLFGLNESHDEQQLPQIAVVRSRLPIDVFEALYRDVHNALLQYGPPGYSSNEEVRSRFVGSFLGELVAVFESAICNYPGPSIKGGPTKGGRTENQFRGPFSINAIFLEAKRKIKHPGFLNPVFSPYKATVTQVMAEAIGCDFHNKLRGCSVPVLRIASDGEYFDFFVYDPKRKMMYRSGQENIRSIHSRNIFCSIRLIAELIFDFLIMGYVYSLRSSLWLAGRTLELQRPHTLKHKESYISALDKALEAQTLLREAATVNQEGDFTKAEDLAKMGVLKLKESARLVPYYEDRGILTFYSREAAMRT